MSNNTGNLPLRKGFQNPQVAFHLKQNDKLFGSIFFQSWSWSFSAPTFFQSWSWSFYAPFFLLRAGAGASKLWGSNWSRLQIGGDCPSLFTDYLESLQVACKLSKFYVHFQYCLESSQNVLKIFRLYGNFPECLESFQIVRTVPLFSRKFLYCMRCFCIIWKVSGLLAS